MEMTPVMLAGVMGEADAASSKISSAIVWVHAVVGLQFAGQNLGMDDEHGNAQFSTAGFMAGVSIAAAVLHGTR
jgi:hypothetical protein